MGMVVAMFVRMPVVSGRHRCLPGWHGLGMGGMSGLVNVAERNVLFDRNSGAILVVVAGDGPEVGR